MTRIDNTDKQWLIQRRRTRKAEWKDRPGRIETRARAREVAKGLNLEGWLTRIVPYVKAKKGSK